MGGGAVKRLDYGADVTPQTGGPPTTPTGDGDGIGGLYAGGAFRNLHFPIWKVTIRMVKDIVGFLDLLQSTAEQGSSIEKRIHDIDKMLEDTRQKLLSEIGPKYFTVVNGEILLTPLGQAALNANAIYKRLPKDDQELAKQGILQTIIAEEVEKQMRALSASSYGVKKTLSASLLALKKQALDKAKNILSAEHDISDKIASITIDNTDEKLAQCNISFWDPAGEFFDAINQWDLLDVQLGWADGYDSERYKIGPIFNGIITNKNVALSSGSAGASVLTATDMGIFTNLAEVKMSYGSDETDTAKFFADMYKAAGLSNDTTKLKPETTGKNIIYKQTIAQYLQGRADVNGSKIGPMFNGGMGFFQSLPKDFRDKTFVYTWFDNIISIDLTADWPLADEKSGTGGGASDDKDKKPPENGSPPDDVPIEAGKDKGPLTSLKERLKTFRDSQAKSLGGRVLNGTITVRGEPRLTNESLIMVLGLSAGKSGVYRVISCQHNTSPVYTTSMTVEYVNIPPAKVDIEMLNAAHDLAHEGEPVVKKDMDKEPTNTSTGPGIIGNVSLSLPRMEA